jgi:hypothetical protein
LIGVSWQWLLVLVANLASGTGVTIGTGMSEELNQPPINPTIRFRLRTMLAATTVLAVLAAIAGPYYRSVENDAARRSLLILWSLTLVGAAISIWMRIRESWRLASNFQIRYIVYARGSRRPGRWSLLCSIGLCALLGLAVAFYSHAAVLESRETIPPTRLMSQVTRSTVVHGLILGSWTAALIFSLVRRPMFLCEEGIPLGKVTFAPWKYIRHAEWQTDRSNSLKLHRLDGDIYVDVPNDVRNEVEAFVRGKTQFVDDPPIAPRFDEPGAKKETTTRLCPMVRTIT